MTDGVIFELLLIFDTSSPSTAGLVEGIGALYIFTLLVLLCLREKRKRTGPTRKEITIMILVSALFFIPIVLIYELMIAELIEPIWTDSQIVIVPIVMFLVVLYSLVLIGVYGTRK